METKRLLTASDVGNILRLSKRAVFRMKATGRICSPITVGQGAMRWRASDIDLWIKWGCCSTKEFNTKTTGFDY